MKEQEQKKPICNNCNHLDNRLFVVDDEDCFPVCFHPLMEGRDIISSNNPMGRQTDFPRPEWCPLRSKK